MKTEGALHQPFTHLVDPLHHIFIGFYVLTTIVHLAAWRRTWSIDFR